MLRSAFTVMSLTFLLCLPYDKDWRDFANSATWAVACAAMAAAWRPTGRDEGVLGKKPQVSSLTGTEGN